MITAVSDAIEVFLRPNVKWAACRGCRRGRRDFALSSDRQVKRDPTKARCLRRIVERRSHRRATGDEKVGDRLAIDEKSPPDILRSRKALKVSAGSAGLPGRRGDVVAVDSDTVQTEGAVAVGQPAALDHRRSVCRQRLRRPGRLGRLVAGSRHGRLRNSLARRRAKIRSVASGKEKASTISNGCAKRRRKRMR